MEFIFKFISSSSFLKLLFSLTVKLLKSFNLSKSTS
jgi:hypothetical protein